MIHEFLKIYTIDDVLTPVEGELLEYSCDEFTAFYGNGELILESNILESNILESNILREVYLVDRIGFFHILSQYL